MRKQKTLEIIKNEYPGLITPYEEVKLADTTHIVGKEFPVLKHKIDALRDKDLPGSDFEKLVDEITTIMIVMATAHIKLEEYESESPICKFVGERIAGKKMAICPIWRAGDGMRPAVKRVFPKARIGSIGVYRDEDTLRPQSYFFKMPKNMSDREAYILDPMLATGGSADFAIQKVKETGCSSIYFLCIIAAPQGVDLIQRKHPDVELYVGNLDLGLNENGYIVPGLGDAGDRLFGTK